MQAEKENRFQDPALPEPPKEEQASGADGVDGVGVEDVAVQQADVPKEEADEDQADDLLEPPSPPPPEPLSDDVMALARVNLKAVETIQKYQRGRVARKLISPELPLVEKIGSSYELAKYPRLLIETLKKDLGVGIMFVDFNPEELELVELHLDGCTEAALQAFTGQLREKVDANKKLALISQLTKQVRAHINKGAAFGRCGNALASTASELRMFLTMLELAKKGSVAQAAKEEAARKEVTDIAEEEKEEAVAKYSEAQAELRAVQDRIAQLRREADEQQAELQAAEAKSRRLQSKTDAIAQMLQAE